MNQVKLTMRRRFPALAGSPEQVFAEFYRGNKWDDAESVSGAGSSTTTSPPVHGGRSTSSAPYAFPPLRLIDEHCPDPAYADKHLGLWRVADIPTGSRERG